MAGVSASGVRLERGEGMGPWQRVLGARRASVLSRAWEALDPESARLGMRIRSTCEKMADCSVLKPSACADVGQVSGYWRKAEPGRRGLGLMQALSSPAGGAYRPSQDLGDPLVEALAAPPQISSSAAAPSATALTTRRRSRVANLPPRDLARARR